MAENSYLARARAASANSTGQGQPSFYQGEFVWKDRLANPLYVDDLRRFAAERGKDGTDEELDEWLHSAATLRSVNSVASYFGATGSENDIAARSVTPEARERAARLQVTTDMAPYFWQDGGRGAAALPDIALGMVTDPVNLGAALLTGGTGLVAKGAGTAALAGRSARVAGALQGAKIGAAAEAIAGAAGGAVYSVGDQRLREELGLSEGISTSQVAIDAALGAVTGGALGAGFGAGGGAFAGGRVMKEVEALRTKGYTDQEIGGFVNQGEAALRQVIDSGVDGDAYRANIAAQSAEPQPEVDPIAEAQRRLEDTRKIRAASRIDAFNAHLSELQDRLVQLRDDNNVGELDDQIAETADQIAQVRQLQAWSAQADNRRAIIDQLLASPKPEDQAKGRQLEAELAITEARLARLADEPVPADIDAFIQERMANAQALTTGRAIGESGEGITTAAQRAGQKERERIAAQAARQTAQAEGVVARDTGELGAATDAAASEQARLTQEEMLSDEASRILQEDSLRTAAQDAANASRQSTMREAGRTVAEEEAIAAQANGQLGERTDEALGTTVPLTDPPIGLDDAVATREAREAEEAAAEQLRQEASSAAPPAATEAPVPAGATTPAPAAETAATPAPANLNAAPQGKKAQAAAAPEAAARFVPPLTYSTVGDFKAGKKVIDRAMRAGVDLREVKGTGKNGRVRLEDVDAAAAAGSSQTFIEARTRILTGLQELTDNLVSKKGMTPEKASELATQPAVLRKFLRLSNKDLDEGGINSLMDIFDDIRRQVSEGGFSMESPNFGDAMKDAAFAKRVRTLMKGGMSQQGAMAQTAGEIAAVRAGRAIDPDAPQTTAGAPRDPRSPTGNAEDALRNNPVAGRNVNPDNSLGGIQSFLKRGMRLGKGENADRTITGGGTGISSRRASEVGAVPTNANMSFEEAVVTAQENARLIAKYGDDHPQTRGKISIQPVISNGLVRTVDRPKAPARKGEMVFVSGATGKAYSSWQKALQAGSGFVTTPSTPPQALADMILRVRGARETGNPTIQAVAKTRAPEASVGDVAAALGQSADTSLDDVLAAIDSMDDFLNALVALNGDGASAVKAAQAVASPGDLPPLVESGKVLVLIGDKRRNAPNDFRMPTAKQQAGGGDARALLGKANLSDFETVGYVPADTPRNIAAIRRALGQDGGTPTSEIVVPENAPTVAPVAREEFATRSINRADPQNAADFATIEAAMVGLSSARGSSSGPTNADLAKGVRDALSTASIRGDDFLEAVAQLHYFNIPDLPEQFDLLTAAHAAAARIEARIAPNGVTRSNLDRKASRQSLMSTLKGARPEVLKAATDFFDRLSGEVGPRFRRDANLPAAGAYSPRSDEVRLNLGNAEAAGEVRVLMHEMAHWAYVNLLSANDRAEFWDFARANAGETLTGDRLVNTGRERLSADVGVTDPANPRTAYYSRPQEYFAERFAQWATSRTPSAQDQRIWAKVSAYLKLIVDFFITKRPIDPALEQLFLKIMPDEAIPEAAARIDQAIGGAPTAETVVAEAKIIQRQERLTRRVEGETHDYMAMSVDELTQLAHPERVKFVAALKHNSDSIERIVNLWDEAIATGDPNRALDAYTETQRYFTASSLSREEREKYLRAAAKAKGEKFSGMAQQSGAFSPYLRDKTLVPRVKAMMGRLNRARGAKGAVDPALAASIDAVSPDVFEATISSIEAADAGLSTRADPTEAALQLMSLVRSKPNDKGVDTSLATLLADMRRQLNVAFEATGTVAPRTAEVAEPAALRTEALGKFVRLSIGDVLRVKPTVDGKAIANAGDVLSVVDFVQDKRGLRAVLQAKDGRRVEMSDTDAAAYTRFKEAKSSEAIETDRLTRAADAQRVRDRLDEEGVRRAREMAMAKRVPTAREAVQAAAPAPENAPSPKEISRDELIDAVAMQTQEAMVAADELMSRELAKPYLVSGIVESPIAEAKRGLSSMRAKILDGDETIDADVLAMRLRPDAVRMPVIDVRTKTSIAEEVRLSRGGSADTGIPTNLPSEVKDLLLDIQHRAPRNLYAARTMAMRLALLYGRPVSGGGMFTKDGGLWNAVRGQIKRVADNLNGEFDGKAVGEMIELVRIVDDELAGRIDALGIDESDLADTIDLMLGSGGSRVRMDLETGELDDAISEVASTLIDRLGYLTNGLIASDSARQGLARLTYFGDLFAKPAQRQPSVNARSLSNLPLPDAMALAGRPRLTGLDLDAMNRFAGGDAKQAIHYQITGGGLREGPLGRALYVAKSPRSLFDRESAGGWEGVVRGAVAPENLKEPLAVAERIDFLEEKRMELTLLDEDPDAIVKIEQAIGDHIRQLETLGVGVPSFDMVVVSSKTPIEMTERVGNSGRFGEGILDALDDGFIPADEARVRSAVNELHDEMTFEDIADVLSRHLGDDANEVWKGLGYDGLKVRGKLVAVLDTSRVKRAEDFRSDGFAVETPVEPDGFDATGRLASSFLMASPTFDAGDFSAALRRAAPIAASGVGHAPTQSWLLNFVRGRTPKLSDAKAIEKFRLLQLSTNSKRMRRIGLNSFADFFEDHFPRVQQDFARRLKGTKNRPGPFELLRRLPDAPSGLKRWMLDSTGRQPSIESHARILDHLLEPSNARTFARLKPDEREAVAAIRREMNRMRDELVEAGVMMGNRGANYFPQVWSPRAMEKDRDGAVTAFANYFRIEARDLDLPFDPADAMRKAERIVAKVSDLENEGVWRPHDSRQVASLGENIDFGRMIELDRHPDALKALKPFLEQDVESYLVRYFDQASHRLGLAKRFGHRNHGVGDYWRVVNDGVSGIADLLSASRTQTHNQLAITPEEGVVELSFQEKFEMPFTDRPDLAMQAAKEALRIFTSEGGEPMARRYLMELAKPDPERGGRASAPYEVRVNAIMDALRDYRGERQTIGNDVQRFMKNALKLASRRPLIDDNTSSRAIAASRAVRSFNSVTLLGFTTIASLGDTVLPIIRSGDMRSAVRGWAKYLSDPDYRRAIRSVGASMESILHNKMTAMSGAPTGRITTAFFNATGLTPWTDVMRDVAVAVGQEALRTAQLKAQRAYHPGLPIEAQRGEFKRAMRMLNRYGLRDLAMPGTKAIDAEDMIGSDEVRVGLMRFADDTIFSPNPNDIPVWAQTPWGAVLFQLKSFPLMMGRAAREHLLTDTKIALHDAGVLKRIGLKYDEAWIAALRGTGNMKRALYLATLAPLLGMGINYGMDVLRGRGGDANNPEHAPAERSASKFLRRFPGVAESYEAIDNDTLDAFVGWYIDGIFTSGGLGLVASMMSDAAQQADNSTYGTERLASIAFGPTASDFMSAVHLVQGIADDEPTNRPERQAVRELAQRVPILGGLRTAREAMVESVAGPARARVRQGEGGSGFGGFEAGGFEGF